jgi:hypothetical protein
MTNKINNPLSLNNVETMSFFYDMGNGQDDITNDVKEGNVFQYHIDKDELMFEEVKKLYSDIKDEFDTLTKKEVKKLRRDFRQNRLPKMVDYIKDKEKVGYNMYELFGDEDWKTYEHSILENCVERYKLNLQDPIQKEMYLEMMMKTFRIIQNVVWGMLLGVIPNDERNGTQFVFGLGTKN